MALKAPAIVAEVNDAPGAAIEGLSSSLSGPSMTGFCPLSSVGNLLGLLDGASLGLAIGLGFPLGIAEGAEKKASFANVPAALSRSAI